MLMDQRHRGGAFADRTAHALHRTGAHVTDREHAAHARLEWRGHIPCGEAFRLTGQHKPMRIEGHAAPSEPLRLRVRAHENEHMADRPFLLETCLLVAPGHRAKVPSSRPPYNLTFVSAHQKLGDSRP